MRVGIIGAGLAGLSSAFYLSKYDGVGTTIYETADVFGGRANVLEGAEHCARIFLDDYASLFAILKEISGPDGRSIYDALREPKRYCLTKKSGWVQVSHLYPVRAKELSLSEKIQITFARRHGLLLADQNLGPNTNRYGSLRNFSVGPLLRMMANLFRSKSALVLEGPTDECLIRPWVAYLRERGVTLRNNASVSAIRAETNGVSVCSDGQWAHFDALIVTAFVSDVVRLLSASEIGYSGRTFAHSHCKCFTITIDAREHVLATGEPAIYSARGITVVLQPRSHRCVVLCTRKCPSTDEKWVVPKVREFLALEFPIPDVKERDNQKPEEAIYSADYVKPDAILQRRIPHLFFAGSYVENSYPVDSGEGAARSAHNAVQRMQEQYGMSVSGSSSNTRTDSAGG